MKLPEGFIKTLHDIHKDASPWLERLPQHLETLRQRWQIRVLTEPSQLPRLSYNLVMFAEGFDGRPYVLKMSPASDEFTREIKALQLYDGQGMARLIEADDTLAAMLLERLEPGISLWHTSAENAKADDAATHTIATIMQGLWRPVPDVHNLRSLESWTQALRNYQGQALPKDITDKAKHLLRELLPTSSPVLLHGDLHHDNVLRATREPFLAIDPKGLVGNRIYDVTPALFNPDAPLLAKQPQLIKILERRASIFSETLGLDKKEILSWAYVQCVLSTIWSIEDHEQTKPLTAFIEALENLLG